MDVARQLLDMRERVSSKEHPLLTQAVRRIQDLKAQQKARLGASIATLVRSVGALSNKYAVGVPGSIALIGVVTAHVITRNETLYV